MKKLSIIFAGLLLSSCSGMGMHGMSGMSGMSGMNNSNTSDSDKPYSQRVLRPGDTYYGG
jgi:hypothetical protein